MASLPLPARDWQAGTFAAPKPTTVVGSAGAPARLSALEWSIVAMAERDGLSTIREPGRYTKALRSLFGLKQPNRLASERLEALRRIAVLAWHYGWNLPKSEVATFLAAGFTSDHLELIQNSVGQARANARRRRAR